VPLRQFEIRRQANLLKTFKSPEDTVAEFVVSSSGALAAGARQADQPASFSTG